MTTERKFVATAAVAVAFASGVMLSRSLDRDMTVTADPPSQTAAAPVQSRGVTGAALPDLTGVAERGIQASVNISSTEVVLSPGDHRIILLSVDGRGSYDATSLAFTRRCT